MSWGWNCTKSNSHGMTLVETMLAMAILSIVTAVVVSLSYNFFKAQTQLSAKSEANEFISSVSKYLLSQQGCDSSLAGLPFPTALATNFTLRGYSGYGFKSFDLSNGSQITPRLKIRTLTIQAKGLAPIIIVKNGSKYSRNIAQIKFSMDVLIGNTTTEIRDRYIEVPLLQKLGPPSGLVNGCNAEMTVEDACTAAGGAFTPPSTCTPAAACQFKGMSYGCWSDPSCPKTNYPAATKYTFGSLAQTAAPPAAMCPAGGTPTSSGRVTYSYEVAPFDKYGRGVPFTNYAYFYICLKCL